MSTGLSQRERKLLAACISVLLIAGTTLLAKEYLDRKTALTKKIAGLQAEKQENDAWLAQRDFLEKRENWLRKNLPTTDSLGRAQGLLLQEFQEEALNRQIRVVNSSLPAAHATSHFQEVAVTMKLYGPQSKVVQWLASLQSPERFYVIKALEIDPDGRSRDPIPQVECDVTIARWFKPDGSITASSDTSPKS